MESDPLSSSPNNVSEPNFTKGNDRNDEKYEVSEFVVIEKLQRIRNSHELILRRIKQIEDELVKQSRHAFLSELMAYALENVWRVQICVGCTLVCFSAISFFGCKLCPHAESEFFYHVTGICLAFVVCFALPIMLNSMQEFGDANRAVRKQLDCIHNSNVTQDSDTDELGSTNSSCSEQFEETGSDKETDAQNDKGDQPTE